MISREVVVKSSVGLHARPAMFFIQKANSYKSSIWIQDGDKRSSAKSLLGVLAMAISGDATITLIADGSDEAEALDGLEEILRTTE